MRGTLVTRLPVAPLLSGLKGRRAIRKHNLLSEAGQTGSIGAAYEKRNTPRVTAWRQRAQRLRVWRAEQSPLMNG